jgi:hypothetical protein
MTLPRRSRPSSELMSRLREAKVSLRRQRTLMSLKEKVAMVLELQRMYLPLLQRSRPLARWERPWDIEP